jgi:acetyl esterase/lipase
MREKIAYCILLISIVLISYCNDSSDSADSSLDPSVSAEFIDVSYGNHPLQRLDVYLPASRTIQTKVIILVHGGAWVEGDKSSYSEWSRGLSSTKGFAVFNINYRLVDGTATWRDQVDDIALAVTYILGQSSVWHYASNKIAMIGGSAGGHLSLLYAHHYDTENKIDTVVSLAGPTDITDIDLYNMVLAKGLDLYANIFITVDEREEASPVNGISGKPTLIFHGMLDDIVPYSQSQKLYDALIANGTICELYLYADTDHSVGGNALDPDVNRFLEINQIIFNWIDVYVQ